MNVDTVAAAQGIINAHEKKMISTDLYEQLIDKIYEISFTGECTRRECKYKDLLHAFAEIEGKPHQMSFFWREFGRWLSEGIGVSNYKSA